MFRPCIDLHDGVVKQIVGGTLKSAAAGESETPTTNFVASLPAEHYAALYQRDNLPGGHVIMLGKGNEVAAKAALGAFPGGLQVGGGIDPSNARVYLDAGASHVIVTSYVFRDGRIDRERLAELIAAVGGRERLVLDLSCRKRARAGAAPGGGEDAFEYVVVTDRWQRWTDVVVNAETLAELSGQCAEFLVHGVDVEGLRAGIEDGLVRLLGAASPIPVTYAGGVRDLADLEKIWELGRGRVSATIGSALDIFGGSLPYADVVAWSKTRSVDTAGFAAS